MVDDLHFLRMHATSGVEISNHFKYIANEFPVTVVFVGVKLAERGLFAEAQTARRTTLRPVPRSSRPVTTFATLSEFPRILTPALAAPLAEAARLFLEDRGLGEVPVYWRPPLHLLDGLLLPGPDPGAVDVAAFHDLTRRDNTALSEIGRQLGTTLDVIRYLLEKHPAPASPTAAKRFGRRAAQAAAEEALSRTQFVDLYCGQRRTLAEIAAMIGVSRKTAGRLARHHGITARSGRPPLDPAWFHDQYVNQRRTLRELGHETGRDVPQMSRIAKRYGIPIRPPRDACRTGQLSEPR